MPDRLGVCLQLDRLAASQYAGWNFNSMCKFGDKYLGADENGVFTLDEGDYDNDELIPAFFELLTSDYGTRNPKKIRSMYFGYEVAHRRTHTHPPRNRYGRWARRNHLHHHFGAPMRNFGVTSPLWDKVFGTYDEPGVVTVPGRMAPVWLLDETGAVKAAFADDYLAKGTTQAAAHQAERDRVAAFANVAPALDA